MTPAVPIIDLAGLDDSDAERVDTVRQIDTACTNVGFFSVVGHGVSESVIAEAHRVAGSFFALPLEQRQTAAKPSPDYPYGYNPFTAEALNRSIGGSAPPDLKETYNVGPLEAPPRPRTDMADPDEQSIWAPTIWPSALPELRVALEAYYAAMSSLAATIMNACGLALGLDDGSFSRFIDHHTSALRLAHYPPLDEAPAPNAWRAGAHSDYGTLTILRLDDEPGLQVLDAEGAWRDVEAPDGALVVNIGDLMQRWSNDRWRSTMHRVVVPPGRHHRARLTMPFFHNANWDAEVTCIVRPGDAAQHPPVLAGAHLMEKFRSTISQPTRSAHDQASRPDDR